MWRLVVVFLLAIPQPVMAVTGQDIEARFALVGVISADNARGKTIVVLKDLITKRSVTLTQGQGLPTARQWRIEGVYRNAVILDNGEQQARVTYAPPKVDDLDEEVITDETIMAELTTGTSRIEIKGNGEIVRTKIAEEEGPVLVGGKSPEPSSAEDLMARARSLAEYEKHLRKELIRIERAQDKPAGPDGDEEAAISENDDQIESPADVDETDESDADINNLPETTDYL